MRINITSKVGILLACLVLLVYCKPKETGLIGTWEMQKLLLYAENDTSESNEMKGFTYTFKPEGFFEQTLPDGQQLSGSYTLMSDSLLLSDTVRNVSYIYKINKLRENNLTMTVFNSFFNQQMQMQFKRVIE